MVEDATCGVVTNGVESRKRPRPLRLRDATVEKLNAFKKLHRCLDQDDALNVALDNAEAHLRERAGGELRGR